MTTPQDGYGLDEPTPTLTPPTAVVRTRPLAPTTATAPVSRASKSAWGGLLAWSGTILLCLVHGFLIWSGMGGRAGLANDWPILTNDHGIHYQHGLIARQTLRSTGTNAGYDPSFMSGYPLSIVSDLSSTLSDLFMLASGDRPAQGYKLYVLVCVAMVPWLMVLASVAWKASPLATLFTTGFFFLYFWTDYGYRFTELGMVGYLASVPIGLLTVAALASYFEHGGFGRWLLAVASASVVLLVHLTSPMLVAPAGLLAYGMAVIRARKQGRPFPASRHVGLWLMAPLILVVNAFWLLPGYWLASTKGASQLAFANPEAVGRRIFEIVWTEPPVQSALLGLAPLGLMLLLRRRPTAAAGLAGFLAVGFGWGYLAGAFRGLDQFQPGRHSYACYASASIAAGIALAEVFARLRTSKARLDLWFAFAMVLVGIKVFAPWLGWVMRERVFAERPFLASQPSQTTTWVVSKVRQHCRPGDRLLYEEVGLGIAGLDDPFENNHVSPVLPAMTGVEVLGGPYLHATVTTNFTQFGENKLFEKSGWDRDFFVRYARLYRPSAICCWSPKARAFCQKNPDLIQVVDARGPFLIARVIGFEGAAIRGKAEVEASPNRLVIRNAQAGEDGKVTLRYHAVPYLRATPPTVIESVLLEDDPVPFIQISPTAGPVTIEMALPWPFGPKP